MLPSIRCVTPPICYNKRTVKKITLILLPLLLTNCSSLLNNKGQEQEKAKVYLQRAVDQFNERQYTHAVESVYEALKYDPESAAAYNHLALIHMETKRYAKAEEAFAKALALQPEYPEVFNNMGVLLNRLERYKEAIPYFEKALAVDTYPTPENAYTNLGHAHYKLGNMLKAKAYHQKALDIAPQFCLASKNMGDIYAKEKKFNKASDYFEQALTICPLFQEAQYKLGLVLMKLGKRPMAKAQLERLIERHKSGPYVERSNEVLKYLH